MQGRQDLNLQPAVLETAALPIELVPFGAQRHHGDDRPESALRHQELKFSRKASASETPPQAEPNGAQTMSATTD